MGARGPKPSVSPQELYFFAQDIYRDFRGLGEGTTRLWFDQKGFDCKVAQIEKKHIRENELKRLSRHVDEEIRSGRLTEAEREDRLRVLVGNHLSVRREQFRKTAAEESTISKKVPGDAGVLKALLHAKTAQRVRQICEDATVPRRVEVRAGDYRDLTVANWPIPSGSGSLFPEYLSQYAEQFIAAKKDSRFPRSDRPSNQLKQLWFLSRALVGALFKITTRTAINLVGSRRPEEMFEESRAAKPARKRTESKEVAS